MSFLIATLLTLLSMIAMVTDLATYRIPNWVNGALLVLYPVACVLLQAEMDLWLHGLAGFAVLLALGIGLFAFKIMGGGDVKMIAVLALWVGFGQGLIDFMILFALLGGVLTLALLFLRKLAPYLVLKWRGVHGTIPRVLTYHEPLPYGVAIGLAFVWVLWRGEIPLLGVL
jgi:prepilin peptidase CpaA